jgi:hypothetical protein
MPIGRDIGHARAENLQGRRSAGVSVTNRRRFRRSGEMPGQWRPLPVVPSSADLMPYGSQNPQHDSDRDQDDSDGPKDSNTRDEADNEQDDSEDDHGFLR